MSTEQLDFFISIISLLIALGGFFLLFVQLRQINKSIISSTQSNIYVHANFAREMLLNDPKLRKYFYSNHVVDVKESSDEYQKIILIAEIYANYFEHIVVQKSSLNKKDWESWINWMQSIYYNSPVLKDMITEKSYYSDDLKKILVKSVHNK